MSYWNLFDIGYNVLERYHSNDATLIPNKYNWDLYDLQKSETNTAIYIDVLLDVLTKVLKNRIATENEIRKLDYPFEYLCYENKFFSDDEIRIGNEYLKWKYPTNSVLLIDSNIIEIFLNTDIIENVGNPEHKSSNQKIDLIDNSSTIIKDDEPYLHWKHDCKMLTKQLVSFAGNKRQKVTDISQID